MNIVFDPRFLTKSYMPTKMTSEGEFRLKIIEKYQLLRQKSLSEKEAFKLFEIKRSTFYRWLKLFKENKWNKKSFGLENKSKRPRNFRKSKVITQDLVSQILKIRKAFPMYGKEKIKILLQRNEVVVSESTIGRIICDLIKRGKSIPYHF